MTTIGQLNQFKLPTITIMNKMTEKKFKNLLIGLNVKTKSDLTNLKSLVENKIVEVYKQAVLQSAMDVINGKYKNITEAPMYRKNDIIYNIPDNVQRWCHFYGLIEKFEKVELF